MKKTAFVLLVLSLMLTMTATSIAAKPVLKVGTEATFVPFETVDEKTNEVIGFDVDLMKAIGDIIGYEIQFYNMGWDGLIPSLLNGNIDVIAAGMTITEDRAKVVNFSDPYFESVLTIVVRKDNNTIKGFEDLENKTIAVQLNTTGDFVAEEIAGARIARYNTAPEALQNVAMNAAHASIIDLPVAETYLAKNPNAPLKHLGAIAMNEFFGLALRKQDTDLLKQINAALAQIRADGTYQQIMDKWF
ncbi:MAG: basic amino acid ABC transporter substrate-binding protein [Firmicutes bacterium]|nr:basic amino acid ABC transporter substrate-binding protein [Bacillota bacterium]